MSGESDDDDDDDEHMVNERGFENYLFEVNYQLDISSDIIKTATKYKYRIKKKMKHFLKRIKERHLNFYIVYHVQLVKETSDGEEVRIKNHLHSSTRRLIHMDDYNEVYSEAIESINKKLDRFHELGSGWRLEKILELNLNLARYQP